MIHYLIKDRYPYTIVMETSHGDIVLMRWRSLAEAEENLRLYESQNPGKVQLRIVHNT